MTRPRLLDLYCGGGGAAMGYHRAGFDVVGVDLVPQYDYPFPFVLANALTYPLDGYDVIHASPPCKTHTRMSSVHASRARLFEPHVDLIPATRERLDDAGVPYVIENVPGAPLLDPVLVCGSAFGLLVRRHRLFESNVALTGTTCDHARQPLVLGVYGHGGGSVYRSDSTRQAGTQVTGKLAAHALGVDWTARQATLAQMIPPAYTEHLGRQILELLA